MAEPLVGLRDVCVHFSGGRGIGGGRHPVRAVDGISLDIGAGEAVGLVGESGSGKTTLARAILGLVRPTSGEVRFGGQDLTRMSGSRLRRLRPEMQMIFQDPYSSLSPRLRVSYLLTEPYRINDVPPERRSDVDELLEMVGLPSELSRKYPHELSGGQARRVGIARALAMQPKFVAADEPTAGLDVSAAVGALNLMKDLADRLGVAYLLITHNLDVVSYVADRVAVMYLGQLVECGRTDRVLDDPAHPYTRALLASASAPDPRRRRNRALLVRGEIPSPRNPPPGCRFHTRCRFAQEICRRESPRLEPAAGDAERVVACHFQGRLEQVSPAPSAIDQLGGVQ